MLCLTFNNEKLKLEIGAEVLVFINDRKYGVSKVVDKSDKLNIIGVGLDLESEKAYCQWKEYGDVKLKIRRKKE